LIMAAATRCRFCGEDLDDECLDEEEIGDDIESADEAPFEARQLLVPTNVSAWALGSCYMGFVGFCLPFAGLLFAIPGLICGIVALSHWRRARSYGAATSNARAVIGIVLSSLAIIGWGTLTAIIIFLLLHDPPRR